MAVLCVQVDKFLLEHAAGNTTSGKIRAALRVYFAAGAPYFSRERHGKRIQTTVEVDDETWWKVKAKGRSFGTQSAVINSALYYAATGGQTESISFD
jgi:hypothetical protein